MSDLGSSNWLGSAYLGSPEAFLYFTENFSLVWSLLMAGCEMSFYALADDSLDGICEV